MSETALRQLLQVVAGNVAVEIESLAAVFAPDPLHVQMRMIDEAVLRLGKDFLVRLLIVEDFQDDTPLQ